MSLPRLLLLTDRSQLPPGVGLRAQIAACVDAGASHVVLRELDLPPSARAALVEELTDVGATVLSAREDLPGAAGIHQPASARGRTLGLTGRSCHAVTEVATAASDGCLYVTLGPFAASASKPGYGPSLSAQVYADLPLPAYALGGVTTQNAHLALQAGAYGVAVMGEVMRSETPGALVRQLVAVTA